MLHQITWSLSCYAISIAKKFPVCNHEKQCDQIITGNIIAVVWMKNLWIIVFEQPQPRNRS